jgi:hypothetical protein
MTKSKTHNPALEALHGGDLSVKIEARRLRKLESALKKNDTDAAMEVTAELCARLRAAGEPVLGPEAPEAVEVGRALEVVVRAIADNRRALLAYRDRFPDLSTVVKDPWSTEAVGPDPEAFVRALAKSRRASVRVDPELSVSIDPDGVLGRPGIEDNALVFRYRGKPVARVDGPRDKLVLLGELTALARQTTPDGFLAAEVPRDVEDFKATVEKASAEVGQLVESGRVLVEAAERLVCALYAIPADLEEEVIAHAVKRAADRHAG